MIRDYEEHFKVYDPSMRGKATFELMCDQDDFCDIKRYIANRRRLQGDPDVVAYALNDVITTTEIFRMWGKTIKKVIFNNPATIVIWMDDTKTVVKVQNGDTYDPEKGLALCCAKKLLGNESNFNNEFKKWLPKEETHNE